MKLRPLGDRVIVKRVDSDTVTKGGVLIPDTATEKPIRGTVLAAGPGKKDDNGNIIQMDVSVDDTVLFGKYSGTEIKHQGEDYLILKQDDIFAVIEA